jgi:hypothetical protein
MSDRKEGKLRRNLSQKGFYLTNLEDAPPN